MTLKSWTVADVLAESPCLSVNKIQGYFRGHDTLTTRVEGAHTMTITIQPEDIAQALRQHRTFPISTCCVVYQALKRSGVPVGMVGALGTYYSTGPYEFVLHTPELKRLVKLPVREWSSTLGVSFDFTQPENVT